MGSCEGLTAMCMQMFTFPQPWLLGATSPALLHMGLASLTVLSLHAGYTAYQHQKPTDWHASGPAWGPVTRASQSYALTCCTIYR